MSAVFTGLSGGVDSAVSAALLKNQGYNVVGAFIKIWQPEFIECTWREDRLEAMRVAATLGIPFQEIDLSESYKQNVVEDMIKGYAKGITPNPDVLCNRHIKFGDFAAWAYKEGADKIATGHYARISEHKGRHSLLRGADSKKDQSYFLYSVEESTLARTLFPVGGMTKSEVRALARRSELPVAERPDSQGLCFVGDVTIPDFLSRFLPIASGPIIDMKGNVVGTHDGAALYTIGQRHGLSVRTTDPHGPIYYVVDIDTSSNTLRVSDDRAPAEKKTVELQDVHWIGEVPHTSFEAEVEARYREVPFRAQIEITKKHVRVDFAEPHIVARGQSLVIYIGERVLGGGIMSRF